MSGLQIHTAPWVVPVEGPLFADGGVAVEENRILAVGSREALQQRFPQVQMWSSIHRQP